MKFEDMPSAMLRKKAIEKMLLDAKAERSRVKFWEGLATFVILAIVMIGLYGLADLVTTVAL